MGIERAAIIADDGSFSPDHSYTLYGMYEHYMNLVFFDVLECEVWLYEVSTGWCVRHRTLHLFA